MAKRRFSRATLVGHLLQEIKAMEDKYDWSFNDGWAVVEGRPTEEVMDFGRYDAFRDLLIEFED